MSKRKTKYIFVSGGVISGLGKGITAASLGLLLKATGLRVSLTKADMYLNVDAGTMNPLEHGEVFVTDDGAETDQDIGHYERFLGANLTSANYFTMGRVYWDVMQKERSLGFGGKCVEGHVHIPEEIIRKITQGAADGGVDISIVEVGGTVGEYQNMMFFEAIRRMKQTNPRDICLVHVVYLPIPKFLGEMKSKPAQASVYEMYRLGLQPDFLVCRADETIDEKRKRTIAFNTGIKYEHILTNPDVDTIYRVPLLLAEQGAGRKVLDVLGFKKRISDLREWKDVVSRIGKTKKVIRVAIAGKYFTSGNFALEDSYVCVVEAVKHAAWRLGVASKIQWFDVERFENSKTKKQAEKELSQCDAIIVPQGWGSRGVEGKISVVKHAREHKIPYLGLCFGMQMAVIEFARNVIGLERANSEEADNRAKHKVIHIMPDQEQYLKEHKYGGTIRLGAWPCVVKRGTVLERSFAKYGVGDNQFTAIKKTDSIGKEERQISERHRHRYEFNSKYREEFERKGMIVSGTSPDGQLVEAIELPIGQHPFFVGTQFHPEYKSRLLTPHPLFVQFVAAAIGNEKTHGDTKV